MAALLLSNMAFTVSVLVLFSLLFTVGSLNAILSTLVFTMRTRRGLKLWAKQILVLTPTPGWPHAPMCFSFPIFSFLFFISFLFIAQSRRFILLANLQQGNSCVHGSALALCSISSSHQDLDINNCRMFATRDLQILALVVFLSNALGQPQSQDTDCYTGNTIYHLALSERPWLRPAGLFLMAASFFHNPLFCLDVASHSATKAAAAHMQTHAAICWGASLQWFPAVHRHCYRCQSFNIFLLSPSLLGVQSLSLCASEIELLHR